MNKFRNILFVADGSKGEQAALSRILQAAHQTGATVTVMQVMTPTPVDMLEGRAADLSWLQQRVVDDARQRVELLVKRCARAVPLPEIVLREGVDYVEIIRQVSEGRHDLVAKAANSEPGLMVVLFGTLDMQLLRKCPSAVLIMKPRRRIVHARVLAALDIDDHVNNGRALHDFVLDHAASIAGFEEGSLDILHAWHLPYERTMRKEEKIRRLKTVDLLMKDLKKRKQHRLESLAKRWEALGPRTHLVKGFPHLVIPRFTRDHGVDLVVMGTVGRSGIPGFFMGNTAEKILRSLNCSVLALKPAGFKSPVR